MNFIKKIFLYSIIPSSLFANTISLSWLEDKPRTIAKDFYIWQYLQQEDVSPQEALQAIGQVRNMNNKILKQFAKKFNHDETSQVVKCISLSGNNLVSKDANCIELGLSTYKATKLDNDSLDTLIEKTKELYPRTSKKIEILNATIPFTKLVSSTSETFFDVFNQCGSKYRIEHFNHKLPKSTIKKLQNEKSFETTLKLIVTTPQLNNLQKSILDMDTTNLSHLSRFYLALNAIIHKKNDLALKYLDDANKKAYYKQDKDKVLFWKYKITNNQKFLNDLASSWDINIYSLYALELTKQKPKNIYFDIKQDVSKDVYFDTSLPFSWFPILNNSRNMDEKTYQSYRNRLVSKETLPHLAFISERFYNYKNSYFITPYEDILKNIDNKRKALIYAIARQESRFIPTSISPAYAMGAMQIMPFLSKAIAKEKKEPYNIYDQLNPKINVSYANHHLNFLEHRLKHPLFISYAYNGGIGFTKNIVLKRFFNEKYDPYLSMELLPYNETRKYGKKVLANYYIYANYFGEKITIQELFNQL